MCVNAFVACVRVCVYVYVYVRMINNISKHSYIPLLYFATQLMDYISSHHYSIYHWQTLAEEDR